MPLFVSLLFGLLLGWLSGGSIRNARLAHLGNPVVLLVLYAIQGFARGRIAGEGWGNAGLLIWSGVSFAIAVFLILQQLMALKLMGAGVMSNLLVVLANGFMPVVFSRSVSRVELPYFYMTSLGKLPFEIFGDTMRLPLAGSSYMMSLGDLLLIVGATAYVIQLMHSQAASQMQNV